MGGLRSLQGPLPGVGQGCDFLLPREQRQGTPGWQPGFGKAGLAGWGSPEGAHCLAGPARAQEAQADQTSLEFLLAGPIERGG